MATALLMASACGVETGGLVEFRIGAGACRSGRDGGRRLRDFLAGAGSVHDVCTGLCRSPWRAVRQRVGTARRYAADTFRPRRVRRAWRGHGRECRSWRGAAAARQAARPCRALCYNAPHPSSTIEDGRTQISRRTRADRPDSWRRSPAQSRRAVRCSMAKRRWKRVTFMRQGRSLTSGFSVHVAKIRLDPSNRLLSGDRIYVVTHDAGRALNRMIVDGQIVGAVADGIGGAIFSELIYDGWRTAADRLACRLPCGERARDPAHQGDACRFAVEHESAWRPRGRRRWHHSGCGRAHQCSGSRHRPHSHRPRARAVLTAAEARTRPRRLSTR